MSEDPPLGYAPGPMDDIVRCMVCGALLPVARTEAHTETHRKQREAD